MRRVLIILMLMIGSIQASWAVVSSYCNHETDSIKANHIGHHVDPSKSLKKIADQEIKQDGKWKSTATADGDCAICHVGGLAFSHHVFNVMPVPAEDSLIVLSANDDNVSFAIPVRPERPKWSRPA